MAETGPLFVSSGDLIADRRCNAALELAARGDLRAAADLLEQTVEIAPRFATAWFALGSVRAQSGDRPGAIEAFTQASDADPEDFHGARLELARLKDGVAPMSQAYVRRLFDQYAARYDEALTQNLDYRGPAVLLAAVEAATAALGLPMRFGTALDLGCGTGLCGTAFRPFVGTLTGVDIAPAMIAKAQAKGPYDRLATADLAEFLKGEAAGSYRLVIAGDVLVYISDATPIFAAVARVLSPGGVFACTVESHEGSGVKLLPTLRYAYSAAHLRAMATAAGLDPVSLAPASVRTEKGRPVPGLVLVARRTG